MKQRLPSTHTGERKATLDVASSERSAAQDNLE